jgi:mannose-6-phosphate isomerase
MKDALDMTALLPTSVVEKTWGKAVLPQPFHNPDESRPVGEIWFTPPPELSELLVKYIFTDENLSVQVHPSDAQVGKGGGKEECWLVIHADPGARLGVGLSSAMDAGQLRAAAHDGSIEAMLDWYPVQAGDFFYIPANTVHVIGGGLTLVEVQQNSDITYRLYDYGRPRALHVEEAVAVAKPGPHDPRFRQHLPEVGSLPLVEGPYFRLDRIDAVSEELAARYIGALLVIPLQGAAAIGDERIAPGQCALARQIGDVQLLPGSLCLIAQPV